MEITKEKFEDYRRCQKLGFYNMFAYRSYADNDLTDLSKEEWFEIIKNYRKYYEEFEQK